MRPISDRRTTARRRLVLTLVAITLADAGHTLGPGRMWDRLRVVRDHGLLR